MKMDLLDKNTLNRVEGGCKWVTELLKSIFHEHNESKMKRRKSILKDLIL